ncbi:hypothetical protein OH76DRAFT_1040236 [Lentinus brumalis]|uniref:Uncharacterized protein n=1 Tax=Lentinus brumalis TaxID=2498619 RepID=A0A371CX00_9APHY|nr:hypothetical protein OH76DRAFT_1040236 [Polyporus brumalis]
MVFDRSKWCFVVPFFARLLIPPATPVALLDAVTDDDEPASAPLDASSPVTSLAIGSKGTALQISARSAVRDYMLNWDSGGRTAVIVRRLQILLSLSAVTSLRLSLGNVDVVPLLQHLRQLSDLELHCGRANRGLEKSQDVLRGIECERLLPAPTSFTFSVQWPLPFEKGILSAVAQMLRARAGMNLPLPVRLVVMQLHNKAREDTSRPAWMDFVRANFAPYVEDFEVREVELPVPRASAQPKRWLVEGAEKYWTLYDRAKPGYLDP